MKECLRIEKNPKCIKIVDIFNNIRSTCNDTTNTDENDQSDESSIKYRLRSKKNICNTKGNSNNNENDNKTDSYANSNKYCYCWSLYDSEDEMIACDCCNEWYHVNKCLFMSKSDYEKFKGRTKYECPDCQFKRRTNTQT